MCIVDPRVNDSNDDVVAAFAVVPGIEPVRSVNRDCFYMPLLKILFRQNVHFCIEFCLIRVCLDKGMMSWKRLWRRVDAPSSR